MNRRRMANSYFRFKQFTIHQQHAAMKVTTDACLFGAWAAQRIAEEMPDAASSLDIGTGTGLLALMLAQKNSRLQLDMIELETAAFRQATDNVAASPWKERLQVLEGDARTFSFSGTYDVLISNPPFYERELRGDHEGRNMAHHDESLLWADLFPLLARLLKPEGRFYLLLPFKREEEIPGLLETAGLSCLRLVQVRQTVQHGFFRLLIEGCLRQDVHTQTVTEEIAIKDVGDRYTTDFTRLLRDYYLYL